jgi:3D (Asp-Asp-Asp) domain-containing protein
MNERIKKAEDQYEAAAKKLIAVVKEVYPIGSLLYVKLGGNYLTVEVSGYEDAWWYRPGLIKGMQRRN